MPNWVFNRITINGPQEKLAEFYERIDVMPAYWNSNDEDRQDKWDLDKEHFSFHSFVTLPSDDKHEEYNETNGSSPDGKGGFIVTGDTPFNWYNWNSSNWNTKWDANSVNINRQDTKCHMSFDTAWAPPEPVFDAMCREFPELDMEFYWEEEQGYGAEGVSQDGKYVETNTWDIPESHADYAAQDKLDSCLCNSGYDPSEYFVDCPGYRSGDVSHFKVEVVTTYLVEAYDADEAQLAVKSYESDYELPPNAKVNKVTYNEEYRVTEQEMENV